MHVAMAANPHRSGKTAKKRSCGPLALWHVLATPRSQQADRPQVPRLQDLEQVDDIHRAAHGQQPQADQHPDRDRAPVVPVVGDEPDRQRQRRQDAAPAVQVEGRTPLREADVREPVVEVPAVGLVDRLAVLEAFQDHNEVSRIGSASTISGNTSDTAAAVFRTPWIASAASRYPSISDPESPMKIVAGLKL